MSAASVASAAIYTGAGGPIADAVNATTPSVTTFTISVPDSFVIPTGTAVVLNFGRGPSGTTVAPGNREHTWAGDLTVTLTAPGGTPIDIMNRLGKTAAATGFGRLDDLNGSYVFSDTGTTLTGTSPTAVAFGTAGATDLAGTNIPQGNYRAFTNTFTGATATTNPPVGLDSALSGQLSNGLWTLSITDSGLGDVGDLVSWSIALPIPEPTTLSLLAGAGALALRRRRA
jgi:hypothetical protein